MNEKSQQELTVTRTGEGSSKTLNLLLEVEDQLGAGSVGSVQRFKLDRGKDKEPAYFAYKRFYTEDPSGRRIKRTIEIHDRLISSPHGQEITLPTMRYTDRGLFMTDLSEGGKNLVMATNDSTEEKIREIKKVNEENPTFINNFTEKIDVFEENWKKNFKVQAETLARRLANAHISIHGDSVFCVIKPDGTYQLKIADLDNVQIDDQSNTDSLYFHNLDEIKDIESFIELLALKLLS